MEKVRHRGFPPYNPIGEEEAQAAYAVVKSGMLSDYLGRDSDRFLGGKHVREFEKKWADYHQVKHAVSYNSATSALIAGVGALGILPADEVIVLSYGMCISATAPLFYDAIPVFVDIEDDCFCIDPEKIEQNLTPRTKAILTVDLFGQSSDMDRINTIARKHGLKVLCDASHVPGCRYKDGFAGTFGDIGIYSLNQHKIIHCGEGGVAVTNSDELAHRLQLIRNHGEAVVAENGYRNLTNMLGGNFRLPEVEAAIATAQMNKLPALLKQRIELANYLTEKFSKFEFLTPPKVRAGSAHVYYLYAVKYHEEATGVSRAEFVQKINDLGIPLYRFAAGYTKPFYLELPIFSEKEKFKEGYPYSLLPEKEQPEYKAGLCPVTERLYTKEMIVTAYNYPPLTRADMDDVVKAFQIAARK